MAKHYWRSYIILAIFWSLFCSIQFSVAAVTPKITGINPTKAVPGQTVEIFGTNLVKNIKIESFDEKFYTPIGVVNSQGTTASFDIPLDFSAGLYKVSVTGPSGSVTSPQNLEVIVGGSEFSAPVYPTAPTQGLPTDLGQLIQQIFTWSLGILGISVFVMFFYSGFLWLTSAGNTSRVGEAKTHMTNAVFGAILLLSSYLILYTINPDFVINTVNLPGLGAIK
ncbi:MAG: hypothetical protein UU70_C0017G0004 [Candidatus Yanofskybacteria bacterium GW2011_GWA1_41_6]|uniref:Uncharacterized protein n=1 Tax=Candidatus Yanofskybacteria bacterium GW2011_GWA1_41_6 TaxID=1619020 RepID=A0A0G0ZK70_9BACT|nr:MAG: hypothetical protein UU70_C0017G0004 [Candidatus Yanofskybacteria bacterium GW2011_GWA1_41_6]